jgi:hypothetical protein
MENHAGPFSRRCPSCHRSVRPAVAGRENASLRKFDYNCGFCKRALPDMLALIKDDPKLKIVLKEFPILGPGSLEAARRGRRADAGWRRTEIPRFPSGALQ